MLLYSGIILIYIREFLGWKRRVLSCRMPFAIPLPNEVTYCHLIWHTSLGTHIAYSYSFPSVLCHELLLFFYMY
jgi:hypothetical protein